MRILIMVKSLRQERNFCTAHTDRRKRKKRAYPVSGYARVLI